MESNNLNTGIIYALICPISGEVKYIGQTTQKLYSRVAGHKYNALKPKSSQYTYKENWIKKLDKLGKLNEIKSEILENCLGQDLDNREIYWIKYYEDKGCKLTNTLPGGKSRRGYKLTRETKRKISFSLRNSEKYKKAILDPKRGKKISLKLKNILKSDKHKKKLQLAQKEYFKTHPGTFKGKKHTPETKLKQSLSHKKTYENRPGTFKGKKHTPETINKIKEKLQKKVELYDIDKNLIKEFNSMKELGDYFRLENITGVRSNTRLQKRYKGKYWLKYSNDQWL